MLLKWLSRILNFKTPRHCLSSLPLEDFRQILGKSIKSTYQYSINKVTQRQYIFLKIKFEILAHRVLKLHMPPQETIITSQCHKPINQQYSLYRWFATKLSLEVQKTMVWQPCWMTEPFVLSSNMAAIPAVVFLNLQGLVANHLLAKK